MKGSHLLTAARRICWAVVLIALFGVLCPSHAAASAPEALSGVCSDTAWEVLRLSNKRRYTEGLLPLTTFASLQAATEKRCSEIRQDFSHTRPDGRRFYTVLTDCGLKRSGQMGENLAAGYDLAESAVYGWMHSSGHRGNLLGSEYVHVGVANDGNHWNQLFIADGCRIDSIEVLPGTRGLALDLGESLDALHAVVCLRCARHGDTFAPLTAEWCDEIDLKTPGVHTVTCSYAALSCSFALTVGARSGSMRGAYREGDFIGEIADGTASLTAWTGEDGAAVHLPDRFMGVPVTAIGDLTFRYRDIRSVSFPQWLESIGDWAFYGSALTGRVTLPDRLKSVGKRAFAFTANVTDFAVGERNRSFRSVDGLLFSRDLNTLYQYPLGAARRSVTLPENCAWIAGAAFAGAKGLEELFIPSYAAGAETDAFTECAPVIWCRRASPLYDALASGSVLLSGRYHAWLSYNVSETRRFIERAYQVILDRGGDESGIENWLIRMEEGESAAAIVRAFFKSDEFKNRGLSSAETVRLCYRAMLDREPDAEGLAAWTALLDEGYSPAKLVALFAESDEFRSLCSAYGIKGGSIALEPMDQQSNVTNFVRRLYVCALRREADEAGLNDWTAQLLSGSLSPERVAFGLIFSDEALSFGRNNELFVYMLYETLLGREPESEQAFMNWLDALGPDPTPPGLLTGGFFLGAVPAPRPAPDPNARQNVYALFAASEEFKMIVESYHLPA